MLKDKNDKLLEKYMKTIHEMQNSDLSSYMAAFSKAISGISILIILVMAWLINYCMRFMLEKRNKEFGTYEILGIEKKSIKSDI